MGPCVILARGEEISKTRTRERPGGLGTGRNLVHGFSVKGEVENLREKDLLKAIQRRWC